MVDMKWFCIFGLEYDQLFAANLSFLFPAFPVSRYPLVCKKYQNWTSSGEESASLLISFAELKFYPVSSSCLMRFSSSLLPLLSNLQKEEAKRFSFLEKNDFLFAKNRSFSSEVEFNRREVFSDNQKGWNPAPRIRPQHASLRIQLLIWC